MKARLALLILILSATMMTGCTTNGVYDSGKTWTLVGTLAVGAVVASSDSGGSAGQNCYMVVRGDGSSSQVCD